MPQVKLWQLREKAQGLHQDGGLPQRWHGAYWKYVSQSFWFWRKRFGKEKLYKLPEDHYTFELSQFFINTYSKDLRRYWDQEPYLFKQELTLCKNKRSNLSSFFLVPEEIDILSVLGKHRPLLPDLWWLQLKLQSVFSAQFPWKSYSNSKWQIICRKSWWWCFEKSHQHGLSISRSSIERWILYKLQTFLRQNWSSQSP